MNAVSFNKIENKFALYQLDVEKSYRNFGERVHRFATDFVCRILKDTCCLQTRKLREDLNYIAVYNLDVGN